MAGPALAHVKGLRLSLGGAPLFDGAEFTLHKGERAALVGANGAGKSTLMRMLAGLVEPDAGEIAYANGAAVALAAQEPDLDGFATLRDYACSPSVTLVGSAHATPAHEAEAALTAFGLDPDRSVTGLSGGETRRASLARAFAADPDILLLDEPTNHLDISAIEDLEKRVSALRGACLIISHDRRFLERASSATLWLRQRRVLSHNRGFVTFDQWAEQVETEEARQLARLETNLKAEEHWLQRGVTARRSRNEGRRRKLEAMRVERRERKTAAFSAKAALQAEKGGETGKLVLEAKAVSKSYGDRALISNLSLRVMRGDRVGVVGPNGAGKTTLLEILLKQRAPDAGEVKLGVNLEIAYVDQSRAILNPGATIWDTLAPLGGDQVIVRGQPRHVAAYAKDFLFGPEQLRQPVSALSGGERNRLALAVALAKPANVLVLDEPTNDLDMDTLDALEDMLAAYDGTVILVSHDRAFLDGVATQIVGPLGDGKWVETPGGWEDFEREYGGAFSERRRPLRPARANEDAAAPKPQRKATKLSYKDERRSAELDLLIPRLDAEIETLEASLSDTAAFARDPKSFDIAAARLAAARAEKDHAETEWLDIETRREALASEQ
ncbi:ABC-F family ATP-binding cassette domain-containing protein [Terricaulis sp.]|uniref:ABC-F family ATP-binding cassette domain-containing protein n=1 Tax=Terricaulis sp. TaxID=2768686 RepID=UPI003784279B